MTGPERATGSGPAPVPPAAGWRGLLGNRRFVLYLAALSAGDIGYAVYAVAAPWLAYTVTHNLFDVGAILASEFGLYAFAFVAAPFVDRAPEKRTVLLYGYSLQAVASFSLGVLDLSGRLDFPLLLGLVSSISLIWDFTWSANNTIPPSLLPKGELFRASGLAGLLSGGNQVTGFTVGGALILLTGAGGAMVLYGALNATAALLALGVSTRGAPVARGSVRDALIEGWRGIFHDPQGRPLVPLAGYLACQGFLASGSVLLITALASEVFPSQQFAYGVLFTAFVLGGAAIGITLGQLNPRKRVGAWLLASPVVAALLLFLAPLAAPSLAPSFALWFGIGAAMLSFEVTYMVYLQASSRQEQVARTTSNMFLFRGSARAVGALALGAVAAVMPALAFAHLLSIGLLVVAGVGLALWRSLRRLSF